MDWSEEEKPRIAKQFCFESESEGSRPSRRVRGVRKSKRLSTREQYGALN